MITIIHLKFQKGIDIIKNDIMPDEYIIILKNMILGKLTGVDFHIPFSKE